MTARRKISWCACGLSALVIAGCGAGRKSEPIVGPPAIVTAQQLEGEHLFMAMCYQCHPGGDAGLGPALNNKPVPDAVIRLQVRQGVGAMPKFPDDQISSRELDEILDYMKTLRRRG